MFESPFKKASQRTGKLHEEHLPKLEKYENGLKALVSRNSYSKTYPEPLLCG